ncbi:unnamed protein product [Sphagnum jensenii]|uniref:DNA topoisomerase (ATP-hydrolyzing) n=1 Tax=Sphagnum jensenii TaxID=128206 RepID=A0ABP0VL02_9BRYO
MSESILMAEYNEASIYSPERLQIIRHRPTQFIHSTGIEGLIQLALEIITNAIDEIALMGGFGYAKILICIDAERSTYQLVVIDNGRGVPIGKLRDLFTKPNTSGKADTSAYEFSGGLFGVGAKATAGLSWLFRVLTQRTDQRASLYIHEGVDEPVIIEDRTGETGTIIIHEPDPTILTEIEKFETEGVVQLLNLLTKYTFFSGLSLSAHIHPLGLDPSIWTGSMDDAYAVIQRYLDASRCVFDSKSLDRVKWIRQYWNIYRPFALQHTLVDTYPDQDKNGAAINVHYDIRLYYVKTDQTGGRFGMINNVPIDEPKSTHLITVMDVIKKMIAPFIKDDKIRAFFLDQYRVPIYMAVDVKYPGYEPAGTTKHAFYSKLMRKAYEESLTDRCLSPESRSFFEALHEELASDIESKYTAAATGLTAAKNTNRMFLQLNFNEKFGDCLTSDRSKAELFLVEGDSGGGGERDREFQGMYDLRGKPLNAVSSIDNIRGSAEKIMRDPIYRDIFMIMGINPAKFNLDTLNFGKCFILNDADPHGDHIAAILLGNFYVVCPAMIEAGIIHVVRPPLYGLKYKRGKSQHLPTVYMRDRETLQTWMAEHVYMKTLSFGIRFKNLSMKTHLLTGSNCTNFLRLILNAGEEIENIASELVVPPSVVEELSYATAYLDLTYGALDVERIRALTSFDRVEYKPLENLLIVTKGRDDHVVPLHNVNLRLIQAITPRLHRLRWRAIQIYITSKNSEHFKDHPVSITELYALLKRHDKEFDIERYKGLASMEPEAKTKTCMDPRYRQSFQITSIGDIRTVINLLGDDTEHRKEMLRRSVD